jgi:ribosomal protein S18 acetylase RimI-like enzyme
VPDERYDRVLTVLRDTTKAVAEEARTYPLGWGVRTPAFPFVWILNQLCITEPAELEDVVALADSHQGDLSFRHVHIEDELTGRRLGSQLTDTAWRLEREVLMVLEAPADRVVDTSRVVDLDEEQMLGLMRRWGLEERPQASADEVEQISEYNRREGKLWNERLIGALDGDGNPVSVTKFRSDSVIGWVEDVYTAPEARGQGHARMLVTYATEVLREGGHELVFIIADEDDWPKELYAKLGFQPVGLLHTIHLDVPTTS